MPMPSKPVLGFSLLGTKRTTGRPAPLPRLPGRRGFRFMAATAAAVRAISSCGGCVVCWANSFDRPVELLDLVLARLDRQSHEDDLARQCPKFGEPNGFVAAGRIA